MGQKGPQSPGGLTALLSPFPSPVTLLPHSLAVPKGDVAESQFLRVTSCTKCCEQGMRQDSHPEGQWSSGAPQMEQTKLQDWDSHMHHPAAKPTHRDTSAPISSSMAGTSLDQESAHPRCQRSYPKNVPSEQQLLLAPSSVFHKRAGALHTHYPGAIYTLHSKAQGQKVDVLQPHPSQSPGSSGTSSARRHLLGTAPSSPPLISPLITPIHTPPIPRSGYPRGCDLQSLHLTAFPVPARRQRGWRQTNPKTHSHQFCLAALV